MDEGRERPEKLKSYDEVDPYGCDESAQPDKPDTDDSLEVRMGFSLETATVRQLYAYFLTRYEQVHGWAYPPDWNKELATLKGLQRSLWG